MIVLQCNHDIRSDHSTIHLLTHCAGQNPATIHDHLRQWIPNNMKWIHKMSSCLLKKKKLDLIIYLTELLKPDFHFDEIAIMIYVRMYQLHIGGVLKDCYWSTHHEQTIEHFKQSDIILTYFGNLVFKDMIVHKITPENIPLPDHLKLPAFLTSRSRPPKVNDFPDECMQTDESRDVPVVVIDSDVSDVQIDESKAKVIDTDVPDVQIDESEAKVIDSDVPIDLTLPHVSTDESANSLPMDLSIGPPDGILRDSQGVIPEG